MKNYNEMANDVLRRIGEHETEQRNRRKTISRIVTPLCCFCLVALLGFGMWQGGMFNATPPAISGEQSLSGDNNHTNPNESTGQSGDKQNQGGQTSTPDNNIIIINTLSGISSDRMNINLAVDDFVEMSREEMMQYYGVNYYPEVPADVTAWDGGRLGVYRRNGGTGEVYWDQDVLNYSNEDYTRNISMEIAKGRIPFLDYGMFSVEDKTSVINNLKLKIGLTDDGWYYTEFIYKDVGFIISAEGLTQDEFVSVIASIIK